MWPFGKSTADRVKDALNEQKLLAPLGLDVRVDGGTAFVSGSVPNDRFGGLVKVVAGGINGVTAVDVSGLVPQETGTPVQASQTTPATPAASVSLGSGQGGSATDLSDLAPLEAAIASSSLAKAAHSAIMGNGELKGNPIDVLQSGSSVILRGVVDSDHEQRLAQQLVGGVAGVSSVDISGLTVRAGAKELTQEKDQGGDTVYTVKSGDTLGAIAEKYFGDVGKYRDIAHYNNISNPDHIQVGQQIRIPG